MSAAAPLPVLIAGVGNLFLSDDGFGIEVAQRLAKEALPAGVRVADYGIRALHLAYALAEEEVALVLVDAMSRGEAPGTLILLEPDLDAVPDAPLASNAHVMHPAAVLGMARTMGARLSRVYVLGCEPLSIEEGIGLSAPVAAAVEAALPILRTAATRLARGEPPEDLSAALEQPAVKSVQQGATSC